MVLLTFYCGAKEQNATFGGVRFKPGIMLAPSGFIGSHVQRRIALWSNQAITSIITCAFQIHRK